MPNIVPFTVRCPTCHGNGYIRSIPAGTGNTDSTHGLYCNLCYGKKVIAQGRLRLDKLLVLYKRVTQPEMQCKYCDKGKQKDNHRKYCIHCKGTRLKIMNIILEFPDKKRSIWEYLRDKKRP
jgi:hypothetical protein